MKTTVELLDAVRARHGLTSDYQVSKLLGLRQSAISHYRVGRSHFDEAVCLKIAKLLELDAGYVLATVAAERAHSAEIRKAWQAAAKALAGTAAGILAGCSLALSPLPELVTSAGAAVPTVYYVKSMGTLILLGAFLAGAVLRQR